MRIGKTTVTISQKEYERQGTAILKDAVHALEDNNIENYEIVVREKAKKMAKLRIPLPKKVEKVHKDKSKYSRKKKDKITIDLGDYHERKSMQHR
jgi:L-rhamnose mutarotase